MRSEEQENIDILYLNTGEGRYSETKNLLSDYLEKHDENSLNVYLAGSFDGGSLPDDTNRELYRDMMNSIEENSGIEIYPGPDLDESETDKHAPMIMGSESVKNQNPDQPGSPDIHSSSAPEDLPEGIVRGLEQVGRTRYRDEQFSQYVDGNCSESESTINLVIRHPMTVVDHILGGLHSLNELNRKRAWNGRGESCKSGQVERYSFR